MSLWDKKVLTMEFITPLCGGVPRSGNLVADWVQMRAATEAALNRMNKDGVGPDSRKPRPMEEVVKEAEATTNPVPEGTEEMAERVWVGFQKDSTGLFVRGANVRAHLKDCAQTLGDAMKRGNIEGLKEMANFKAHFTNAIYIAEERLYLLGPDGKVMTDCKTWREATMTVMTRQGPRTCLKRVDCIDPPVKIVATIQLLTAGKVSWEHVKTCLEYGEVHGFNQDRSLQYGRYKWTLTPFMEGCSCSAG